MNKLWLKLIKKDQKKTGMLLKRGRTIKLQKQIVRGRKFRRCNAK